MGEDDLSLDGGRGRRVHDWGRGIDHGRSRVDHRVRRVIRGLNDDHAITVPGEAAGELIEDREGAEAQGRVCRRARNGRHWEQANEDPAERRDRQQPLHGLLQEG